MDNQRTRTKLKEMDEELVMKDPFTSFAEFYKEMQGREMNGEEENRNSSFPFICPSRQTKKFPSCQIIPIMLYYQIV